METDLQSVPIKPVSQRCHSLIRQLLLTGGSETPEASFQIQVILRKKCISPYQPTQYHRAEVKLKYDFLVSVLSLMGLDAKT